MTNMFALPGSASLGERLTRSVAETLARNWWRLLLNGAVLIVAGALIFSIDWSVESLATFIGALFIFEGFSAMLTPGVDARVRGARALRDCSRSRPAYRSSCGPSPASSQWRSSSGHG